jgi:citrate lyase gamma subunit
VNPSRVDSIVDLTYGLLIALSVGLIVVVGTDIGLAFGFGVLVSYVLHVVWKMARFDPNWMTTAVKETVDETVEEKVGETVEKTVGETVEKTVGETVEKTVEAKVGEAVEKTVEEKVDETVEKTLEEQRAAEHGGSETDGTDEAEDR